MKRLVAGGVALVALSSAALALETAPPLEARPAAEASPYNWTEFDGRSNTLMSPDDWLNLLMSSSPIGPLDSFGTQYGYNHEKGTNYEKGAAVNEKGWVVPCRRSDDFLPRSLYSGLDSIDEGCYERFPPVRKKQ